MTDLAPDPVETEAPEPGLELRVLAGRAQGARALLAAGAGVSVGHGLDSDIVVRDPAARGVFLKLTPRAEAADLELLSGQVEFLGHVLTAPARAILPCYVPLLLGDTAVAVGHPDGTRWPEAEQLLHSARPEPEAPSEVRAPALWRELLGLVRKTPVAPVLTGIAIVACSGAVVVGGRAAATLIDVSPSPASAAKAFREAGYPTLTVSKAPDGRLAVKGLVATSADRAKLEKLAAAKGFDAAIDVRSGEDIALGVTEVMRANGVTADVRPAGLGVVSVAVRSGGDPARLEAAQKIALRDVGGLKRVLFAGGGGLGGSALSEDPRVANAKRVQAVVAGDGGYVETADGARYFTGAVLPTGHVITDIQPRDVTVQRDGQTTHLLF